MMNIQELQTVSHHRFPIKLFVLNNNGYVSIKQTQESFFQGHFTWPPGPKSGVTFPDMAKIAKAFRLRYERIKDQKGLKAKLRSVLRKKGPVLCEVILPESYIFSPKLSSQRLPDGKMVSKPLEDMFPFLDREELKRNMLIPEWEG